MTSKVSEVRKVAAMRQKLSSIVVGILEDDSHADTCLIGKVCRTLLTKDYYAKVSGFSEKIGKLKPPIVDDASTVRTDNDDDIIIQIDQSLSKPDENVLLMSNFQGSYNVTRIDTAPMYFNPKPQFGIVITNGDVNDTLVKFTLKRIATGFPIRIPSDEELDTISIYEIKTSLFWYPSRKFNAKN